MGRGDFLIPKTGTYSRDTITCTENTATGAVYNVCRVNGPSNVNLFRGSTLTGFRATATQGAGEIRFGTKTIPQLVRFPVRVSTSVVGTTSTPTSRVLERFVNLNQQSFLQGFLGDGLRISANTSLNQNTTRTGSTQAITPINANIQNVNSNLVVTKWEDIPAHNGNPNIRAIKGNLTVQCNPGKSTFEMTGVRTVLVEGNITFECNTSYPSGDTTSSWSWIAKGGDILIDNGSATGKRSAVSGLHGVYVAVKEGNVGGSFRPHGDATTNTVLRIDGTLYGNAVPLFESRTYARATGTYQNLTTGTILTYSNRALVSPPPLLSQYLNHYKIQRVVR